MKCADCGSDKDEENFHKAKSRKSGRDPYCKDCKRVKSQLKYREHWFRFQHNLRSSQCKSKGIPYDLDEEYLKSIWTNECPITGKPFVLHDKGHPDSPSLDRIIPELGYTKGNVVYISWRMNRIKYDATCEEIVRLADWMKLKLAETNA